MLFEHEVPVVRHDDDVEDRHRAAIGGIAQNPDVCVVVTGVFERGEAHAGTLPVVEQACRRGSRRPRIPAPGNARYSAGGSGKRRTSSSARKKCRMHEAQGRMNKATPAQVLCIVHCALCIQAASFSSPPG